VFSIIRQEVPVALRFFFGVTCGREEMKRHMQFQRNPRKLPVVLSVEEIAELMAAVPGPGLKYRAALGISYGAGLRASEVCNLRVTDIDSDRMLIHVEEGKGGKDRKAMLSPALLDLLREYWREARPPGWLFPGKPKINPISPRQLIGPSPRPGIRRARPRGRAGWQPLLPVVVRRRVLPATAGLRPHVADALAPAQ
jgi:integrase